ncbi:MULTISPECIES: hypothetical protein [Dictyoglomus]|jgi:hypothetical protein|uniref:hypothetical protein n=1 Tax=Dictyoglomus TaxID=13 RepID=UPI003C75E6D0
MDILKYFLILLLILILFQVTFANMVPVVENRSKVIARVRAVFLKDFPFSEIVLEILKSENVEGFKNFAEVGDIILVYPISLKPNISSAGDFERRILYTCYFLKPGDMVRAEIEFIGDEVMRGWVVRDVERIVEVREDLLKDVIYSFLKAKGVIKEGEGLEYKVVKDGKFYKVKAKVEEKEINIILDENLVILNYF